MSRKVHPSDLTFLVLLTQHLVHRGKFFKEDCLFSYLTLPVEEGKVHLE